MHCGQLSGGNIAVKMHSGQLRGGNIAVTMHSGTLSGHNSNIAMQKRKQNVFKKFERSEKLHLECLP